MCSTFIVTLNPNRTGVDYRFDAANWKRAMWVADAPEPGH